MKKLKTYSQFNEGLFFKDDNKKLLANLLTRLDIADHIEIKDDGKEVSARIDAMANLKINWKRKTAEYGDKMIKLDDAAIERIKAVLKKFEPVKEEEIKKDDDYEDLGFDSTFMLGGARVKVPKKHSVAPVKKEGTDIGRLILKLLYEARAYDRLEVHEYKKNKYKVFVDDDEVLKIDLGHEFDDYVIKYKGKKIEITSNQFEEIIDILKIDINEI